MEGKKNEQGPAGRLGYAPQRMRATAQELVDGLAAMGRPGDAAAVAAAYLADVDAAVALLARACDWREVRAAAGVMMFIDTLGSITSRTEAGENSAPLLIS